MWHAAAGGQKALRGKEGSSSNESSGDDARAQQRRRRGAVDSSDDDGAANRVVRGTRRTAKRKRPRLPFNDGAVASLSTGMSALQASKSVWDQNPPNPDTVEGHVRQLQDTVTELRKTAADQSRKIEGLSEIIKKGNRKIAETRAELRHARTRIETLLDEKEGLAEERQVLLRRLSRAYRAANANDTDYSGTDYLGTDDDG